MHTEAVVQTCSVKKGVLRNFAKVHRKIHVPVTLFKKETLAQVFFCEFCEVFKKIFFTEHLRTTDFEGK